MHGNVQIKGPNACTGEEFGDFARLVRLGFDGSDEGLEGRIRGAHRLGFHYAGDGTLAAIAGLKVPAKRYREQLFGKAGARARPADYRLELGWVFVVPAQRGSRIGGGLCRLLLARVPSLGIFATTRPDHNHMIAILDGLGFARAGAPFPSRHREHVLFLRPGP